MPNWLRHRFNSFGSGPASKRIASFRATRINSASPWPTSHWPITQFFPGKRIVEKLATIKVAADRAIPNLRDFALNNRAGRANKNKSNGPLEIVGKLSLNRAVKTIQSHPTFATSINGLAIIGIGITSIVAIKPEMVTTPITGATKTFISTVPRFNDPARYIR